MPIPVPSQHHMFSNRQRLLDLDYQVSISPHDCYLYIIMFPIYHTQILLLAVLSLAERLTFDTVSPTFFDTINPYGFLSM